MSAPPETILEDLETLLREADAVQLIDYWRLEALADRAIALAEQAQRPVEAAEGLAYRGWARLHLNDRESALRAALDALIIAREHGTPRVEYLALRSLAVAFDRGGLPQEALRLHELQHQIVEKLQEPRLIASVLNNMGVVELTRDPEKAARKFLSALAVLPDDDDSRTRRVIMSWNASVSLGLAGQPERAMGYGVEAVRIAKEIGTRHWAARAQVSIAFIHALQGDFKAAHECFEQVRPEMDALNFPVLTAEFHLQFGGALMREGRTSEAVDALETAYRTAVDHDLINMQVDILKSLAGCYESLNDMDGVVDTYTRMTDGIVNQQRRGAELRFAVMRTAFDINRASVEAHDRAANLRTTALRRLSSEFSTPLAAIQTSAGEAQQYGEHISPETTRARLEEITSQVQWMTVMMDDIAELLQPKADDFPVTSFTLAALTQSLLADVARYQLDAGRMLIGTPDDRPQTLYGTFDPLRRSLVQIVANALKFSRDSVIVTLVVEDSVLSATVTDTGIGIPEGETALVLRPMYRASNAGAFGGTGLGLALVDKLADGAGADLDIRSQVGSGTTVTLRWPLSGPNRT